MATVTHVRSSLVNMKEIRNITTHISDIIIDVLATIFSFVCYLSFISVTLNELFLHSNIVVLSGYFLWCMHCIDMIREHLLHSPVAERVKLYVSYIN